MKLFFGLFILLIPILVFGEITFESIEYLNHYVETADPILKVKDINNDGNDDILMFERAVDSFYISAYDFEGNEFISTRINDQVEYSSNNFAFDLIQFSTTNYLLVAEYDQISIYDVSSGNLVTNINNLFDFELDRDSFEEFDINAYIVNSQIEIKLNREHIGSTQAIVPEVLLFSFQDNQIVYISQLDTVSNYLPEQNISWGNSLHSYGDGDSGDVVTINEFHIFDTADINNLSDLFSIDEESIFINPMHTTPNNFSPIIAHKDSTDKWIYEKIGNDNWVTESQNETPLLATIIELDNVEYIFSFTYDNRLIVLNPETGEIMNNSESLRFSNFIRTNEGVFFLYQNSDNIQIFEMTSFNPVSNDINQQNSKFSLTNYPNPFNPTFNERGVATTFSFNLLENNSKVTLTIYNILGQKIKSFDKVSNKGKQSIIWDGKVNNSTVSSGVYFYRLNVNNQFVESSKCLIIK